MDATLLKSNMTKLEEKVLKTKAFIDVLNKDKAKLQELNNQSKEELKLVQEEFEDLKKVHQELVEEHNKLKMDYTFANSRVNELEKYVDEYKDNSEQLAQSIARSLDTLEDISGLEDIELLDNLNEELNAAEDYTTGSALESELLDLEDLENN
jgi:chromosome segregation ATPase